MITFHEEPDFDLDNRLEDIRTKTADYRRFVAELHEKIGSLEGKDGYEVTDFEALLKAQSLGLLSRVEVNEFWILLNEVERISLFCSTKLLEMV